MPVFAIVLAKKERPSQNFRKLEKLLELIQNKGVYAILCINKCASL